MKVVNRFIYMSATLVEPSMFSARKERFVQTGMVPREGTARDRQARSVVVDRKAA